jgi:hypothetical protein
MRRFGFAALVAVVALGCGGSGPGAQVSDGARAPASGEEAGVPGSRGGGMPVPGGGGTSGSGGMSGSGGTSGSGGAAPDAARDVATAPDARPDATPDLAPAVDRAPDVAPMPDGPVELCGAGGMCATIEADYIKALQRARTCDPMAKNQCGQSRATTLGCPGCSAWVTSAVEVDSIRAQWDAAGCAQCKRICPLIACKLPTVGECRTGRGGPVAAPDRILPPGGLLGTCWDKTDPQPVGPAQ